MRAVRRHEQSMAQSEDTWKHGSVATLNEAASSMPVPFNPQSLINHDAAGRPWNHLPAHFPRTVFDPECLVSYEAVTRSRLLEALRTQQALVKPSRVRMRTEVLEEVFGEFHTDHAFCALRPDWGINLTEPMATRALAYLLGRGTGELRDQRIRAFLKALEISNIEKTQSFAQAKVYTEVDRIDLEVRFQDDEGQACVAIVEAKFNHRLTAGQLSSYYEARRQYRRECRIVGLMQSVGNGRRGKQEQIWPVVLWRDLWLRFEKGRPQETDGQLATFMAWLWLRIDGLNVSNSNSRGE